MNKAGKSVGFGWIFALVSLFGIGILYIIFSQVFKAYLVPTIVNQINSTAGMASVDKLSAIGGITKYMAFFDTLPFILFIVIIIYMIVLAVRKEGVDEMQ